MSDIEVQADAPRVDAIHEFQILVKPLDQQARFRFDQQVNLQLLGQLDARHQLRIEQLAGPLTFRPGARQPPGSVVMLAPRVPGPAARLPRVLTADRPVVRIRLGPPRVPVRLSRSPTAFIMKALTFEIVN